ncbi:hypothetical protein M513_04982, partial [Trichuris suis]
MSTSAQSSTCESVAELLRDWSECCDGFAALLDFQGKVSLFDISSGYNRCNGLISCVVAVRTMAIRGSPSWPGINRSTRASGQNNRVWLSLPISTTSPTAIPDGRLPRLGRCRSCPRYSVRKRRRRHFINLCLYLARLEREFASTLSTSATPTCRLS